MSLTSRVFAERRRILVPVLAFLGLNLAGLGGVFWLQRMVDGAEDARMQAILDLDVARRRETAAKAARAGKERADVELKQFYSEILPKDFPRAVSVVNFWLGKTAESARLRFRAGQWDEETVRGSQLKKVTGQVTLVGEYADIRRFLFEVEAAEEFVIIEKVELSQPNATAGSTQIELALSVATYILGAPMAGAASR
jgi:Tfp pilus assembly protein PilO